MNLNDLTGVGPKVWVFVVTSLALLAPILLTWGFMEVKGKDEQRWISMKNWMNSSIFNCLVSYWRYHDKVLSGRKFWFIRKLSRISPVTSMYSLLANLLSVHAKQLVHNTMYILHSCVDSFLLS
jgi:hypothetical protein